MEKRLQNSYVNLHEKGMLQMGIPFFVFNRHTSMQPASKNARVAELA